MGCQNDCEIVTISNKKRVGRCSLLLLLCFCLLLLAIVRFKAPPETRCKLPPHSQLPHAGAQGLHGRRRQRLWLGRVPRLQVRARASTRSAAHAARHVSAMSRDTLHALRYDASSTAASIVASWEKKHHASLPPPPPPASAIHELACTTRPCGLAPEDSVHAVVSAASAAAQPCFWWIQEKRSKSSGILKVRIDAACFGANGSGSTGASGSSGISSVFSIRSPPGCTLRDVTAAIAHKAAAHGLCSPAAAASSCIVCACLPHPHLPPAAASHVITGTGPALDMPVEDVELRLGRSCVWSARAGRGGGRR